MNIRRISNLKLTSPRSPTPPLDRVGVAGSGGSRDFALGWQRGGNRSRGGAEVRGAIYGKKIVLTHIVI